MRKDYEKLFTNLKPKKPPAGLFDRIIFAIKREQELKQTKKLLFSFLFLLVASIIATPISGSILVSQIQNSGILHFISAALSDFGTFLSMWQNFGLAILESLPLTSMILFTLSLGMSVFTLRLFIYRKRLLLAYLINK